MHQNINNTIPRGPIYVKIDLFCSLAYALLYAAHLHEGLREFQGVQERAEELLAMVTEHGFAALMGPGLFLRGWALATQGQGTLIAKRDRSMRDCVC